MTIRRRLLLSFSGVLTVLIVFAAFQTWVYRSISDININLMLVSEMTERIENIRKGQATYLDLNARRYITAIDDELNALKVNSSTLITRGIASKSDIQLEKLTDYYRAYEAGLKAFISTNDQYHALLSKRNAARLDLVALTLSQEQVVADIYKEALAFTVYQVPSTGNSSASLEALISLADQIMTEASVFEYQLFGRRLSVLARDNRDLIQQVDQVNLKNQTNLYFIEQELENLYNLLVQVRMSEQAYANLLYEQTQYFYWLVILSVLIALIIIGYRMNKRINGSVQMLVKSAETIAGGDYSVLVDTAGTDEFALLGHHMNQMTEALRMSNLSVKTYSNQLEHLVKVKTYELTKANESLAQLNNQLEEERNRFADLAMTDMLTGLNNRGYFMEILPQKMDEARRYGKEFTLCLLDLDHFKLINDQHGHMVGDAVLRQFAHLLKRETRASDIVARYGGEEFIILFAETNLTNAYQIAERIRRAATAQTFELEGLKLTVSGGLTAYQGETESVVLKRVDDLLYAAKKAGRNRIETG